MALADAHAHGADEALWLNTRGELCEGSGSNIFVVTSGRVFTPELRSGCLGGITRELLLEWCYLTLKGLEPTAKAPVRVFIMG